jgi:hypothetical protein
MRNWSVKELTEIEFDLQCLGDEPMTQEDAEWLKDRISMREMHGGFGPGRCDACGIIGGGLLRLVDDYSNAFDGPCPLSLTYLCLFCR